MSKRDPEFRKMRNKEQIERRNKDVEAYFNEQYKAIKNGSHGAKYNIAIAETAQKFYLSERRIQDIIKL